MNNKQSNGAASSKDDFKEYIDLFEKALESHDTNFSIPTSEDTEFCEKIYNDYDKARNIDASTNLYSFHIITIVEKFLAKRIKTNKSFQLDDDENRLIKGYYKTLSSEYGVISSKDKHKTFKNIEWIKDILQYIDSRCDILKNSSTITRDNTISNMVNSADSTFAKLKLKIETAEDSIKLVKEDIEKHKKDTINKLTSNKEEVLEIRREANNTIPHMLTSLGIFVSIIIAVVVIYLSDLIAVYPTINANYISQMQFARYIVSGQIICNLIFLMLYIISRLTNKNILLRCSKFKDIRFPELSHEMKFRPCANCENKANCNYVKKMWNKAGYIVFINVLCIICYVLLYDWWLIEVYLWPKFNAVSDNIWCVCALLLIVNISAVSIGIYFLKKIKHT